MRKTKIVCTIGPACDSEETLRAMMLAGMNVARLNFSHGTHAEHQVRIDRIKKLRAELDLPIAIMLDTKGPEYRIGTFENGKIELHSGDTFTFTTDPQDHLLSGNFGPADLVDPGTSKVIGSYVVNGNRNPDGSMNDNMITIVTTLSEDGAQFPSLHNGFFTLEGYVQGTGNDIVFTVNGEALAPVDIVPEPSRPIPDTPLLKYGTQEAGQNQIR